MYLFYLEELYIVYDLWGIRILDRLEVDRQYNLCLASFLNIWKFFWLLIAMRICITYIMLIRNIQILPVVSSCSNVAYQLSNQNCYTSGITSNKCPSGDRWTRDRDEDISRNRKIKKI